MRYALILTLLAAPALAETPMTGAEFEEFMTGKTLTFSANGQPYGIEYYGQNRQVIWSFIGGECITGEWYDEGSNICFVYDNDPEPKCWEVFEEGGRIRAVFMNRPSTTVLYDVEEGEPLVCGGVGA